MRRNRRVQSGHSIAQQMKEGCSGQLTRAACFPSTVLGTTRHHASDGCCGGLLRICTSPLPRRLRFLRAERR
eukprot:1293799-Rhodomonas_salina.3